MERKEIQINFKKIKIKHHHPYVCIVSQVIAQK